MSDGLSFYDWWAAHDEEKAQLVADAFAIEQLIAECVPAPRPSLFARIIALIKRALTV